MQRQHRTGPRTEYSPTSRAPGEISSRDSNRPGAPPALAAIQKNPQSPDRANPVDEAGRPPQPAGLDWQ